MKKNILYTMLFAMVALMVTSCGDKSSEGLSRITYYPTIALEGGNYVVWNKGEAWVDPGYASTLNGEDVSSQVTISGSVDVNTSGIYTLTYNTVKNEDGFGTSASRTVVVLDRNSAIEGFYTTTSDSYRSYNGKDVAYGAEYQILIIDNGDGTLDVDDLFGGWYAQRAGYGVNYAAVGTIALAEDGSLSLVTSLVPGWGDSLVGLSGSYDAASSSFKVVAEYVSGMVFNETWIKE